MKKNTSNNELTISSENLLDVLELTDADLLQAQGGCGNGGNNYENYGYNDGCNNGGYRHHRQGRGSHYHHSSCGSYPSCNSCGSYPSCNSCGNR